MERYFVDTSAWFEYANGHDPDHARIRIFFQSFEWELGKWELGTSFTGLTCFTMRV
jgi:predicted nucleic acid-binding protein